MKGPMTCQDHTARKLKRGIEEERERGREEEKERGRERTFLKVGVQ